MTVVSRILVMAALANVKIDESMINRQILAFAWARVNLRNPRTSLWTDLSL